MEDPLNNVIGHLLHAAEANTLDAAEVARAVDVLKASQPKATPSGTSEPQDRREQILAVAARVFAEKGYHGTNLQDIATEVGCTRPTFYYYFKNKQEILATITDAALDRAERVLDTVVMAEAGPVDKLRLFIREYAKINAVYPEAPVLFRAVHELPPEAQELSRKRRSSIDHRLAAIIDLGNDAGVIRSRAPLITAFGILGAVNWMHTWYRPDADMSWEEIADVLADLLLDGLVVES